MPEAKEMIRRYPEHFPEDVNLLDSLKKYIQREENIFDRKNRTGYIVVNVLILYKSKIAIYCILTIIE
jgi:hypothetical protein